MFVLPFLFVFSSQLANNDFFQALNDRRVFQTDVMTYSIEDLVAVASEHTPKNTVRNSDTLKDFSTCCFVVCLILLHHFVEIECVKLKSLLSFGQVGFCGFKGSKATYYPC